VTTALKVVALLRARLAKLLRYAAVSAISTATSLTVLGLLVGLLNAPAGWANVAATAIGTVPSFELNRRWVWLKRNAIDLGRSRTVRRPGVCGPGALDGHRPSRVDLGATVGLGATGADDRRGGGKRRHLRLAVGFPIRPVGPGTVSPRTVNRSHPAIT
jgi:hypothetical protein